MTIHDIDENIRNSDIEECINEYVRLIEHREILRERWFQGLTLDQLAEKHHISTNAIKKIIYTTGDRILLKAAKI